MTIYQLECFIAVAEELNFSAAAQRLFTTQPAVTYQINTLEKETGLHLFDRTTRRTKLTAAGQSFYLDMVQMTSFGRQALKKAQDIQAADRSHLVVGLRQLFDYGTFASILAEYQRQYPNAQVEVIPQSNRRPLEELRSGQLDIGFFYATEHSSDRDVSFTPLFSLAYYVLMNPNCPLADRKALHLADLKGQTIVAAGKGSTPEYALRYLLTENGIDPDNDVTIDWKSEHSECVAALASGQATIALLPQPFVTVAQTKIEGLRIALDLTAEWDKLDNGSGLITGVIVARRDVVEANPGAVDSFLQDYAASVEWVNANNADAAQLIAEYGIIEAAPVAEKALPYCNIVCLTGSEMKDKLSGYLKVLSEAEPSSVGGTLPGDDFYYGG